MKGIPCVVTKIAEELDLVSGETSRILHLGFESGTVVQVTISSEQFANIINSTVGSSAPNQEATATTPEDSYPEGASSVSNSFSDEDGVASF